MSYANIQLTVALPLHTSCFSRSQFRPLLSGLLHFSLGSLSMQRLLYA